MNYIDAKSELLEQPPKVSLKMFAIEAATLLIVAAFLVRVFSE